MGIPGTGLSNAYLALSHAEIENCIEESKKTNELFLDRAELRAIPSAVFSLTNLTHLDLSENELTRVEGISTLTRLEILCIHSNTLISLPREICFLHLTTLILFNNQITSLPKEIGSLGSLKGLSLAKNLIPAIPSSISQLLNLEFLDLRANRLFVLPDLSGLKALVYLHLDRNQLQTLNLENMPNLLEITAKDNPLSKIELKNVKPIKLEISELESPE